MDSLGLIRLALSLAVVIGLIFLVSVALRRYGNRGSGFGQRGERRLAVLETLSIDQKRRLLLIRRDDTEHLLLIGGGNDLVIDHLDSNEDRRPLAEAPALPPLDAPGGGGYGGGYGRAPAGPGSSFGSPDHGHGFSSGSVSSGNVSSGGYAGETLRPDDETSFRRDSLHQDSPRDFRPAAGGQGAQTGQGMPSGLGAQPARNWQGASPPGKNWQGSWQQDDRPENWPENQPEDPSAWQATLPTQEVPLRGDDRSGSRNASPAPGPAQGPTQGPAQGPAPEPATERSGRRTGFQAVFRRDQRQRAEPLSAGEPLAGDSRTPGPRTPDLRAAPPLEGGRREPDAGWPSSPRPGDLVAEPLSARPSGTPQASHAQGHAPLVTPPPERMEPTLGPSPSHSPARPPSRPSGATFP